MAIAKTILHEAVHADLLVKFNIDYSNVKKTYPELFNWFRSKKNDQNGSQHEFVFPGLINDIALALKQFGDQRGYDLDYQIYQDLAWSGLESTTAFNALDGVDKQRILNRIIAEHNGITKKDSNGKIISKREGQLNDCAFKN